MPAKAQIIYESDFETPGDDTDWVLAGIDNGTFAIGTPEETTFQLDRTWSGTRALVTGLNDGNSANSNDVDAPTYAISPLISIPAGASTNPRLEFHYYYAHSATAQANDQFQAYVIQGGNLQLVYSEQGGGGEQSPRYQRVGVDLSAYAGQTIQVAFQVVVETPNATMEVAIDDVQVLVPATLSGTVWNDADDDGVLEGGETGLEGVLVELLDENGIAEINPNLADDKAYVTFTDSSGNYQFENLQPGNYQVKIATPPGAYGTSSSIVDTADNQEDNDNNGIQALAGGEVLSPVIALSGGEVDDTVDFGLVPSPVTNYTFNSAPVFSWFDGTEGAVWNATDSSATYDISYTDSFGNTQTLTVTMTIVDPFNRNGDDAADAHSSVWHPFDPAGGAAPYPGSAEADTIPGDGSIVDPWDSDVGYFQTETDGGYGLGYLSMGIKPATSDERVAYRFSFSKPVRIIDLEVSDIDGNGIDIDYNTNGLSEYEIPGNSFQDRVEFYGRNGTTPVQVTVNSGAQLIASNGTVYYDYDSYVAGDLSPEDALGTTTVSSDLGITEFDIYYSNGGDDAANEKEKGNLYSWWSVDQSQGVTNGVSDDQAIRIGGFGLVVADDASISGNVSIDQNGDDTGDVNFSNVTLTLYSDPNGDGDPSDGAIVDNPNQAGVQNYTVVTDASGNYAFSGLPAGDYVVVEEQPSAYVSVSDGDSTDSSDDVANASIFDNQIPVSLAVGEADTGNDFVEEEAATISGSIYADTDNDDVGEALLPGVTVALFADTNGDGVPDGSALATQEATDGTYSFTDLAAGDYVVVETQPSGYLTVSDGDSTDGGDDLANIDTTDNLIPVSVDAGEVDTGNDFIEEETATISGSIFADTDNDDVGEDLLPGVTVSLFADTDGDGVPDGSALATQESTDGTYSFTGLAAGDYVVVETQPSGYLTVSDGDSTDGGDDLANVDTTDNLIPVSVDAGETDSGNDFIEELPAAISGSIFADTDNDDVGEDLLPGVTVSLFADTDGDGVPDGSALATQEATDGTYSFTGLAAGDYVVVETQPSGYLTVSDEDSTDGGDDLANVDTTDNLIPVSVDAGETDSGNDFIEELPATISGSIYADTDNDDVGEDLLPGVTVSLFADTNGDGVPDGSALTTQEATDGTYSFTGLAPGSYVVVETQPSGYLTVSDGDSIFPDTGTTADAANSSPTDNQIPVTVDAGETDAGNDFIEELPATISG
ncbi:MAG: SdrD B-like domain-containing protein, partial [Verrucomicrobiota bacterium JB023]|nr:SdrD B-like domain-containing protein [Verrucomicrobiota bacterium JB023]